MFERKYFSLVLAAVFVSFGFVFAFDLYTEMRNFFSIIRSGLKLLVVGLYLIIVMAGASFAVFKTAKAYADAKQKQEEKPAMEAAKAGGVYFVLYFVVIFGVYYVLDKVLAGNLSTALVSIFGAE